MFRKLELGERESERDAFYWGELRLTYREIIIQEKYNEYYILIYSTTQFDGGSQKQLIACKVRKVWSYMLRSFLVDF